MLSASSTQNLTLHGLVSPTSPCSSLHHSPFFRCLQPLAANLYPQETPSREFCDSAFAPASGEGVSRAPPMYPSTPGWPDHPPLRLEALSRVPIPAKPGAAALL